MGLYGLQGSRGDRLRSSRRGLVTDFYCTPRATARGCVKPAGTQVNSRGFGVAAAASFQAVTA
jgi:hypothetical protein